MYRTWQLWGVKSSVVAKGTPVVDGQDISEILGSPIIKAACRSQENQEQQIVFIAVWKLSGGYTSFSEPSKLWISKLTVWPIPNVISEAKGRGGIKAGEGVGEDVLPMTQNIITARELIRVTHSNHSILKSDVRIRAHIWARECWRGTLESSASTARLHQLMAPVLPASGRASWRSVSAGFSDYKISLVKIASLGDRYNWK